MAITDYSGLTDTGNPKQSADESKLLTALDELEDEGRRAKERWIKVADSERDLKLYRGELGPEARDPYFECNFIQAFIDRMSAGLTENRPTIRVEQRKAGLRMMAGVLDKCAQSVWDESEMQRQTYKMAHNAAINRSAGMYTGYDPTTDEVYLEMIRANQVVMDPAITEAAMAKDAEYLMIDRVRPIAELAQRFPGRGALVKPDASVSETAEEGQKRRRNASMADLARGAMTGGDALGRAHVKEFWIKDRQIGPDGRLLFPGGRQIFRTRDYVLYDGPNLYWDGRNPFDWYEWIVDPVHPWGSNSEPGRLMRLQASFNQLLDGLIENQLLTNFIQILADYDAVDDSTYKKLESIASSIIIRKRRNSTFQLLPPAPFGADKIALARALFTFAQLLTGVTDVTLGEHPGSLQSGQAIEGLQEGASLMNRSRASRLEDFYTRVGQKLIARVIQFWPSDRVISLVGPTAEAKDYVFKRSEFFMKDDGSPMTDAERREVFRYLRFVVHPGSSMPGSRAERGKLMMMLVGAHMASREDALQGMGFPEPAEMLARADEDAKKLAPKPAPPPELPPRTNISLKGDLDAQTAHTLAVGQHGPG